MRNRSFRKRDVQREIKERETVLSERRQFFHSSRVSWIIRPNNGHCGQGEKRERCTYGALLSVAGIVIKGKGIS